MSRISETKVVQFIESYPPKLVVLDESTGAEILFNREEVGGLIKVLPYLFIAMVGGGEQHDHDYTARDTR